ncbi:MAG: GDSL-type esterase/lipase family protein [Eubacteriales bacterium]|nr:GDSL-type esterase/lipase family protein [Eubacteriales bacterium]
MVLRRLFPLLLICALLAASLPALGEGQPGTADFYDGAVFVGDSILQQLGRYALICQSEGRPLLGEARFLTAASYTIYLGSRQNAYPDEVALKYRGIPVSLHEGLKTMEASRAFVLLGLNDNAGTQLEKEMGFYSRLIQRAMDSNPGLDLIILSMTPVVKTAQTEGLNQANLDRFNLRLQSLCGELGVAFLDVAAALKDEEGFLNRDYSSDKYVHLNPLGLEVLAGAVNDYARERMGAKGGSL